MFTGMFKTTLCKHEFHGCAKGSACVFAHTIDNQREFDAEVIPLRFGVYKRLYDDGFSLHCEIRHEISQMSDEGYKIEMRKKDHRQERVDEQVANAAAERSQRPRMHDNSRSPRSSQSDRGSRTPDPNRRRISENYSEFSRAKAKGKGKGDASALMEVDDDARARQRDLTSGGADDDEGSDREDEAVAPIDDTSKELTPPKEESRSLSPCDDNGNIEPTLLPAGEIDDTDMTSGLLEVGA